MGLEDLVGFERENEWRGDVKLEKALTVEMGIQMALGDGWEERGKWDVEAVGCVGCNADPPPAEPGVMGWEKPTQGGGTRWQKISPKSGVHPPFSCLGLNTEGKTCLPSPLPPPKALAHG